MPAFVAALFGSLAAFFTKWLAARTAMAVAAVAVFATLTLAFTAAIATAITAVAWSGTLPDGVVMGLSFFMPSNAGLCIATIFSADIAAALYRWNARNNALLLGL